MVDLVHSCFRPTCVNQAIFEQFDTPTLNLMFHKGVYHSCLSRAVANLNPVYASIYGFLRGALDYPFSEVQRRLFGKMLEYDIKEESLTSYFSSHKQYSVNKMLSTLYIAVNFFASIAVVYTACKVGELAYSLVGRVNYRPFGISEVIKVEGTFVLFTVVIDLFLIGTTPIEVDFFSA